MGAVGCAKHGTKPGVLCCDHVRSASEARLQLITFNSYRTDMTGDGTELVENLLCDECAMRFHLSKTEAIAPEIWESRDSFPYVCPACRDCLSEWQREG
jgi:hypothetical protein